MPYTKTNWQNWPSIATPISAAKLNNMENVIAQAADDAAAAAAAAVASASLVGAPPDVVTSANIDSPASLTRKALDVLYQGKSLTGTYSARPAANAVPAGTTYLATNIPEQYRSTGAAWVVVGAGGSEIAYAETVANFTTTSVAAVDVTGLSVTFVAGERPIVLRFDGVLGSSDPASGAFGLLLLDGVQVASAGSREPGGFRATSRSRRVAGLVPGSTHVAKIAARSEVAGATTTVYGGATNVSSITVETA